MMMGTYEAWLNTITERVSDSIIVLDEKRIIRFANDAAASIRTVFSEIAEGAVTPDGATGIVSLAVTNVGDTTGKTVQCAGHFELRVNSSSQIEHDSSYGGDVSLLLEGLVISTFGWIDHRGRLQ